MQIKVEQMQSPAGNPVTNQFVIFAGGTVCFQSYSTIIAERVGDKVTLDTNRWEYSSTTSKYRNIFLGESTQETQKKIDAGIYKLANLNK